MHFRIDIYHHFEPVPADAKLDDILTRLTALQAQGVLVANELQALTDRVTETETVEQSAIELLTNLSAQIASLKDDPVQLQALADRLAAKRQELADAIVANTPAAPTP